MLLLQALDLMAEGKHDTSVSRPLVLYISSDGSWVCVPHTGLYVLPSPHTVHAHESYTIPAFVAITEGNGRQRIMAKIDSSIACLTVLRDRS